MSTTSNPHKNTFGRKPRRGKKYGGKNAKMVRTIVKQELESKERKAVELKAYDITHINGSTISYNSLVTPLTASIARGTGPNERVGSEIYVKGILLRYQLVPNAQYNNVRVQVIRWNSSGTPNGSNILQFTGAVGASMSPLIRDASHKFQVLFDQLVTIGVDMADDIYTDKVYIKNPGRTVWDDSNGGQKGQLFLVCTSDSIISMPGLFAHARIKYTDQ